MREVEVPEGYLPETACLAEAVLFRALAAEVRAEATSASLPVAQEAAEMAVRTADALERTEKYGCETPLYRRLAMDLGDFLRLGLGFASGRMGAEDFAGTRRRYAEGSDRFLGFAIAESHAARVEGRAFDILREEQS